MIILTVVDDRRQSYLKRPHTPLTNDTHTHTHRHESTHTHTHTRAGLQCNSISIQMNSNINIYQRKWSQARTNVGLRKLKNIPLIIRLLAKTIEDIPPKYLFLMILLPFSSSRKCEATHLLTSSFN